MSGNPWNLMLHSSFAFTCCSTCGKTFASKCRTPKKVQGDYLWRKQFKINAHTQDAHVSFPKGNNTAARHARTQVRQAVAVVVAAVRIRNVQAPSQLE
jgi:hypothetical protein